MTVPSSIRDTPVLIAGAGPVGLALAIELGLQGVECVAGEQPWSSCAVSGRRLPHLWVSPQVSTLDLLTGTHLILTADGALGARADRAAASASLPVTVTRLEPPLMRRLGAELLVVRPD
jgi:hypothetical protein